MSQKIIKKQNYLLRNFTIMESNITIYLRDKFDKLKRLLKALMFFRCLLLGYYFKQFMKVMLKGCYIYKMIFSEQSFLRFIFDYSRIFVST